MGAYVIIGLSIVISLLAIFLLIKGLFKRLMSFIFLVILAFLVWFINSNGITRQSILPDSFINQFTNPSSTKPSYESDSTNPYYQPRLEENVISSLDENGQPLGAVNYGATFVVGDLDEFGRATYGHILIRDSEEPGQNGEKRPGKIYTDPAGWKNYKLGGTFVNDRTHTIGYQFGGVNSDPRVLTTAGAYLNRGTEGKGSDETNIESMLFYEQHLDSWLANHPNYQLDYYVQPIYEGNSPIVKQMYMQWVGIDENGNTLPINIGGLSKETLNDTHYVLLDNKFPSYNINYQTGQVTYK